MIQWKMACLEWRPLFVVLGPQVDGDQQNVERVALQSLCPLSVRISLVSSYAFNSTPV